MAEYWVLGKVKKTAKWEIISKEKSKKKASDILETVHPKLFFVKSKLIRLE